MKNRFVYLPLLAFLLATTSCSHRVVRTGYERQKTVPAECAINITKDTSVLECSSQLGEIKLGDKGFSVFCSEEKALEILEKEACIIGANSVLIIEERLPSIASSCYRCQAVFLKIDTNTVPACAGLARLVEKDHSTDSMNETKNDSQVIQAIVGAAVGFAIGFLLMTVVIGG